MFANNVFPSIFDDTAQAAYMESTETYTRLFQDAEKYRAIIHHECAGSGHVPGIQNTNIRNYPKRA